MRRSFTYHLPEGMPLPEPGRRLVVEFGRKRILGFCLGSESDARGVTTKPVVKLLDRESLFPRRLFELCVWMADYYFANPADCLAAALPPALKTIKTHTDSAVGRKMAAAFRAAPGEVWEGFFAGRKFRPDRFDGERTRAELKAEGWSDHFVREAAKTGALETIYRERDDDILSFVTPRADVADLVPNSGQQAAIDSLKSSLGSGFGVTLLHGVTGSGKTLVYCQLAREVLERGKSVLVLTPEIALSGSALAYFRGFFGETVTVIHSATTERERLESWRGIREGRYRIVVGPRSALLAPLNDVGLIVVDEEHDGSYKQSDPAPRFHGRDAAIMRGKLEDVPVLLGSASPSVESYHHAASGRYRLLKLEQRTGEARLPGVTIIDMRTQKLRGDTPYLSYQLKKEIDTCLEADRQAILFLNRRGYSPQLKCGDCGAVPTCPECDIKLTYHKSGGRLWCHYCGFQRSDYHQCEKCGGNRFLYLGVGTQKVEEHVARLFKKGKVLRFDSDTASGRRNAHQLLHEFSNGQYNLLLGTQMVTKGLDLPRVTLVGVLSADMGIDIPDFRAGERTFARLLQVAGRSGRADAPGEVFIQTYYPESEVIQEAARQDYEAFYAREIESRKALTYPPFSHMVRVLLSAVDRKVLESAVTSFAQQLEEHIKRAGIVADVLGPADCPIAQLRGRRRCHIIIRTLRPVPLVRMLTAWEEGQSRFGLPSKVRVTVDVDPDDMM